MAKAKSKKVVGFIVGDVNDGGKLVKTAEEAAAWLQDAGAEVDGWAGLTDDFHCFVLTADDRIICADVEMAGITVDLPVGYSMAEDSK